MRRIYIESIGSSDYSNYLGVDGQYFEIYTKDKIPKNTLLRTKTTGEQEIIVFDIIERKIDNIFSHYSLQCRQFTTNISSFVPLERVNKGSILFYEI